MNLLADHADIKTDYGGGLVVAIDGVESTFKHVDSSQAKDWFYWVDGRMADVGATFYELHGGESVWWDYHEWAKAMAIPWSLDAVPQLMAGNDNIVSSIADQLRCQT
jgi:hypothetical protein